MKKAIRFFSLALAVLMILPMLVSLPVKVSATEPAIGYSKTYAAASDGELLYKADFRGTSGVWSPGAAWCGMTATKAADGSYVKLKPQSGSDARGCAWRGELNTANYTAIGCSYTVTFTLDGSNDNQYVGFFPDWRTGFIFTPGQKKTSVGQCDGGVNLTAVAGEETYSGGGDGAQSYAVEFSVGNTKNGNYYTVSTYKLYVWDGEEWTLIRELNANQRSMMRWSDGDPEVVLGFFRNPVEGQRNQTVTVSNLKVYRGLCADALSARAYEAAQNGDLLYRANFNGTPGVWSPGAAWSGMTATVAADGSSVKLKPQSGSDARGCAWRGELNAANYTAIGCSYTITFTLDGSNDDQYVGFFPDWKTGFIFTPGQKKTSVGQCDGGVNLTAVAGETTYTGGGDGAQSYAVEFSVGNTKNGNYYTVSTYKLYVRDGAEWTLIRELNASQRSQMRWSDGDPEVVLGFFRNPVEGQRNQTVTVSNLRVYRGLCADSLSTSHLSVMSYNIEYLNDNHDPGVRNTALVPLTVQFWGTDIVGLQEVDSGWEDDFTAYFGGYSRVQGDTTCGSWPEILYKTTRFNELSSGYKRYSDLADLFPNVPKNGADPARDSHHRLFTWALLKDKETGKKILAISTHLHLHHHAGEDGNLEANALLRDYEIRLMLAWLNAANLSYDAVVVVGDMNTHYLTERGETTINIFKNEGGFAVARDSARSKGDIDGTLVKDSAPGTRNLREQYIFDLILTKGSVETTYYTVFDNKFDNGGTSYPSDHVPVFSTLIVY